MNKTGRPKIYPLFTVFSILSLILFVLTGYFVLIGVAPSLERFIINESQLQTVVNLNRLANQFLNREDFIFPLNQDQEKSMSLFLKNADLPGKVLTFVTDRRGRVIYVEPRAFSDRLIGASLISNSYVNYVLLEHKTIADFTDVLFNESKKLGLERAFVQAVPITFGESVDLAGVVYSISRVGFITQTIKDIQKTRAIEIAAGFLVLYIILSIIVAGASLTIRRQNTELSILTQRQIIQAQELAKLKDQFVFVAAHELRSPVTAISLSLELLEKSGKNLNTKAKEMLVNINSGVRRLKILINDLLDASRLETGKFIIHFETVGLVELLKEIITELKPLADEHKIKVELKLPKDAPSMIITDRLKFKEIVSNLISNAVKYNYSGGFVAISAILDKGLNEIIFEVADNGWGISQEDQKRVFERFWRSEKSRELEGTGLGLWITKQIAELLGGRVWMKSQLDAGSVFSFSLPMSVSSFVSEPEQKAG